MEKNSIAVLMTCHNRKEKTINCLLHLNSASLQHQYALDIYLVDDGSTDGTKEAVRKSFPEVKIIIGDGGLYWNQGMRLAWETAIKNKDYDYFLWLNDDTIIDDNALDELLTCYCNVFTKTHKHAIIVGSCRNSPGKNIFSYGGRTKNGPVIPNGKTQSCTLINGNLVLIPNKIYKSIGMLSIKFTHALGDFDYGLTAIRAGYGCYVTTKYIASCQTNGREQTWLDPKLSLISRWKNLHSPKGLNIKEYLYFKRKHDGIKWISNLFRIYIKLLFPKLYKGENIKK